MVQQTIESKFSEYGLPNTDAGRPNQDKKLPLPMTTKKTVLRDLQNENRNTVPKSVESSFFLKENGPEIEAVKGSGTKRTVSDHLVSSLSNQSQSINAANGHLVYVRRKPEVELAKSSIYVSTSDNAFCSQARKLSNQHQTAEEKLQVKESPICIPEVAPIPRSSLTCFSSGKPSVLSSLGKSPNNLQPTGFDNGPVSLAIPLSDFPKRMNNQHWEERYCQLQDLLEMLDQSNQENYVQMLRSLSSECLSSHAIELEKRSIQLSLEEAKEMQRVQLVDVLGKYSKNSRAPIAQRGQTTSAMM